MARLSVALVFALIGAAQAAEFDCTLYQTTCVDPGHSAAYAACDATVAINPDPAMECRMRHLGLAASDPALHCDHAKEAATGECATETLAATFDCASYQITCVDAGITPAYADCAATVAANPWPAMSCRAKHLAFAASAPDVHCTHAEEAATGPCASETLAAAAAPTAAPTASPTASPTVTTMAPTASPTMNASSPTMNGTNVTAPTPASAGATHSFGALLVAAAMLVGYTAAN